jgi:Holliday junction DNA helicase RuvA
MIGHIQGEVLFSDGAEIIISTNSGIGYQITFHKVLAEGQFASLFISHVIREAAQTLYGFESLRDKKLFELLMTVKGVGPKGAYAIVGTLGSEGVIQAVLFEDKKALSRAPGIGAKAAAQIILDLQKKITSVRMYSTSYRVASLQAAEPPQQMELDTTSEVETTIEKVANPLILEDTILACKELGFKEDKIRQVADKILASVEVDKAEQLVHLVLKEM